MNKKPLLIAMLFAAVTNAANAGPYTWTSGWAMGVSEHLVDDGNSNSLNISCPDDDGSVSAYATIDGKEFNSKDEAGFDVIVDGETYSNPFFTDCNVCGVDFPGFWQALRQAKRLELVAGGKVVRLPTTNIATVLLPLNSPKNTCRSAW